MSNQKRKYQQEDDSRLIMAFCILGLIIVLVLYSIITTLN